MAEQIVFERIKYEDISAKQKENYNFHIIAARLAEFGYNSIRLTDDYLGADFIAIPNNTKENDKSSNNNPILRIQLKGRLTFNGKYWGKNLYVAFREADDIYVYPHDELCTELLNKTRDESKSEAWVTHHCRSWNNIPKKFHDDLAPYKLDSVLDA